MGYYYRRNIHYRRSMRPYVRWSERDNYKYSPFWRIPFTSEYRYMGPWNPMSQGNRFRGPGLVPYWHDKTYGRMQKYGVVPYKQFSFSDKIARDEFWRDFKKHPIRNLPSLVGAAGMEGKMFLNQFTSNRYYTGDDYLNRRAHATGPRTTRGLINHYIRKPIRNNYFVKNQISPKKVFKYFWNKDISFMKSQADAYANYGQYLGLPGARYASWMLSAAKLAKWFKHWFMKKYGEQKRPKIMNTVPQTQLIKWNI